MFFASEQCSGRNDTIQGRGEYSIVLQAGGGYSYYLLSPGVPGHLHTTASRFSPSATVRLMWYPDHRLRVGVESGWTTFYQYRIYSGPIEGNLRLTAVPLLIVWSMSIGDKLNLYGGTGTYFIHTKLDYAGKASSGMFSLGWMLAASYVIGINEKISVTPEVKWLDASETKDQTLGIQLLFNWKFLKW
jgi:hypothetical protein